MKDNERRNKKREYLNAYQAGEDGRLTYTGEYRSWADKKEAFSRYAWRQLALSGAAFLCPFAAGWFPETGMEGCFYLLLPYAAGLLITALLMWTAVRILKEGPVIKEYVFRRTVETIRGRSAAGMLLSAITLAGILLSLITGGFRGKGAGAVVFFVSQAAQMAFCLLLWKQNPESRWNHAGAGNQNNESIDC